MTPPAWARPVALLFAAYVAIMYVATFWMVVWHDWDWYALRWLSAKQPPAFSSRVVVLDVKNYDRKNPQYDRRVIAALLERMRAQHLKPAAVLLDFFFETGDANRADAGTAALRSALDDATRSSIQVYATISKPEMLEGALGTIGWSQLRDLDWAGIYDRLSGGAGHTILNAYDDGLFYQTCYRDVPKPGAQGRFDVRALPYLAVESSETQSLPPCDPSVMKVVRVGSHDEFVARAARQISLQVPLPPSLDLDGKYVVVATLESDLGPVSGRSNPELIAWALSDLLASPATAYYEPVPYGDMLLVLIAIFSLLALGAFVAVFGLLRRRRLGTLRAALPWISAAIAAGIVLALFAGLEALLLASKSIQPQVSLVSLSVLIVSGLSAVRARQILHEQASAVDVAPEETHDYDVFISYAHDELAWVHENVYLPFRAASLPDGRKLSIFFDTSSLQVGSAWQQRISLAIDGSRFVVPVYSETYFTRPYCRFEIRRAHRKWIAQGEGSRCVLPIMRGHPKIDQSVDDIQAVSIDDDPGIIAKIVADVVERLQPR